MTVLCVDHARCSYSLNESLLQLLACVSDSPCWSAYTLRLYDMVSEPGFGSVFLSFFCRLVLHAKPLWKSKFVREYGLCWLLRFLLELGNISMEGRVMQPVPTRWRRRFCRRVLTRLLMPSERCSRLALALVGIAGKGGAHQNCKPLRGWICHVASRRLVCHERNMFRPSYGRNGGVTSRPSSVS